MRWLLHGEIDPAAAEALRRHGHSVQTMPDAGIQATDAADILKQANTLQLDVVTTDAHLTRALLEGSAFGRSVVLLQVERGAVEQDDAIDRLFARYKRLAPGRLYTVTSTRVKVRQWPGAR